MNDLSESLELLNLVSGNNSLSILDLAYCQLSENTFTKLFDILEESNLQVLDLSGNIINR
jgi:hypothetical protein